MKTYTDLLNDVARKSNMLKELTAEQQRQLKEALIEEYKVIKTFCDEHHLTVFFGGGSCLGAVRHQGFIPWDDDLDLNMPRNDYNKLIELIEQGVFPEGYEFSYPSTRRDGKNLFLKIYIKGTKFVEINDVGSRYPKGINIDIFPMENVPKCKIARRLKALCFEVVGVLAASSYYDENRNQMYDNFIRQDKDLRRMHRTRCVIGRMFRWIGHKRLTYWADRVAQHRREGELVTFPTGRRHYMGEVMPRSVFLPVSMGVFEGMEVNLPNRPQQYLENLYGKDFMQVPPEDKRERHFIIEFEV